MRETPDDLMALQMQLNHSAAHGGTHLLRIFEEARRPTAAELCDRLAGILEVHVGCVTTDGTPLVAPIDALVYRARLWVGFSAQSVRARIFRRDPRISVSFNDHRLALIVHGTLVLQPYGAAPDFIDHLKEQYAGQYGDWWPAWFDAQDHTDDVGGYIEPRRIFARRPD